MDKLLNDKSALIQACRSMDHSVVIKTILANSELQSYIGSLTNNNKSDSQEIIHDTTLSFIRTAMKKDFSLTKPPLAYLKTIAKNLWLMKQRGYRKVVDMHQLSSELKESYLYQSSGEKKELVAKILNQLKDDCKEILTLWAYKYKMAEIAQKLKIESTQYLKKKKHLCLKKLIAIVNRDPKFKEELRLYV